MLLLNNHVGLLGNLVVTTWTLDITLHTLSCSIYYEVWSVVDQLYDLTFATMPFYFPIRQLSSPHDSTMQHRLHWLQVCFTQLNIGICRSWNIVMKISCVGNMGFIEWLLEHENCLFTIIRCNMFHHFILNISSI